MTEHSPSGGVMGGAHSGGGRKRFMGGFLTILGVFWLLIAALCTLFLGNLIIRLIVDGGQVPVGDDHGFDVMIVSSIGVLGVIGTGVGLCFWIIGRRMRQRL